MDPRRYILVAAMTIALGLYGGLRCDQAEAGATILFIPTKTIAAEPETVRQETQEQDDDQSSDPWLDLLGAASEDEDYDSLYAGRSLAEIAEANGADVQSVIDHQIGELGKQLGERLATGSITPEMYLAQLIELEDIVTRSAHTGMQA